MSKNLQNNKRKPSKNPSKTGIILVEFFQITTTFSRILFARAIENNGLKHLIIPDFLNAIEKDYTTRKDFLNLIKTLIEEGITSLDQFNIRTDKIYDPPIKCGLITGITSESFHGHYDQKKQRHVGGVKYDWKRTGLLSRFIPFSYEYELSKIVARAVIQFLAKEEHEQPIHQQTILRRMVDVKGNSDLFQKLQLISSSLGQEIGGYGFRAQRSLQSLAKANAVLNNRREVTQDDIDKIMKLSNWMNFRNNPL
jgi:hypothetical protein